MFSTLGAGATSKTSSAASSPAPTPPPPPSHNGNVNENCDNEHVNNESEKAEGEDKDNMEDKEKKKRMPRSWWEPDEDSGRFLEQGAKPRGFRFMKMNVKLADAHLLVDHVSKGNGKIRCFVKLNNVRKQMKMTGQSQSSVIVEKRTPETHPLICPFADPVTNQPCDAMFKKSEQKFFKARRIFC